MDSSEHIQFAMLCVTVEHDGYNTAGGCTKSY